MNPIAAELNATLDAYNVHVCEMLSEVGKKLFFPKGILSQGAEAKGKAHRFNATIGMATEHGGTMYLPTVMSMLPMFTPEEVLTYAPSYGIMPLRKAWKQAEYEKNPSLEGKLISLPVVTNAITHGLSVIGDMWVDPGDVIILPDKIWGNYNLIFEVRRGARIVQFPLFDERWHFNLDAFERCVREQAAGRGKVIVLLNLPNNPTGYNVTPEEAAGIADILAAVAREGTNVVAVADDAYFGLVFEQGVITESIFSYLHGRDPRLLAIKLDGATKEDLVWGLRVGFITYGVTFEGDGAAVYDALEKKTGGAVRGSISNASHLGQEMLLRALGSAALQDRKTGQVPHHEGARPAHRAGARRPQVP